MHNNKSTRSFMLILLGIVVSCSEISESPTDAHWVMLDNIKAARECLQAATIADKSAVINSFETNLHMRAPFDEIGITSRERMAFNLQQPIGSVRAVPIDYLDCLRPLLSPISKDDIVAKLRTQFILGSTLSCKKFKHGIPPDFAEHIEKCRDINSKSYTTMKAEFTSTDDFWSAATDLHLITVEFVYPVVLISSGLGNKDSEDCDFGVPTDVNRVKVAIIDTGIADTAKFPNFHSWPIKWGTDYVDSSAPFDQDGHGTHTATMITRLAPNAELLIVRALARQGEDPYYPSLRPSSRTDRMADAILEAVSKGAQIVNNSWGTPHESSLLHDAINQIKRQAVVVTIAGNSGSNIDDPRYPFYPASFEDDNILSVLAVEYRRDQSSERVQKSAYSSWGVENVDFGAFGVGCGCSLEGKRAEAIGTSVSAARATARLAVLIGNFQKFKSPVVMTPQEAIAALIGITRGTDDTGEFSSYNTYVNDDRALICW